ncbi:transposase [Streptomyces sp. NPDC058431]|uniref:transposase n=1 Tax=Streptomyces sp. NPDC058431 TaxID=3346496 RepID=UPI0036601480
MKHQLDLLRLHYARNLLSQVPKSAQPWVATLLRTVFEQPNTDAVTAQMTHVLDALEAKFPKGAVHLDAAQHDEWTEARRYLGIDLLGRARLHPIESETDDTTLPTELIA